MIYCVWCGSPLEEFVSSFQEKEAETRFNQLPDNTPVDHQNFIFAPTCQKCGYQNPPFKVAIHYMQKES